jgi:oxaloacetate decarboxylase gamma subunit
VPGSSLLVDGLTLMLLGMGIVFAFLVVLVFSLKAMSRFATVLDRTPVSRQAPAARGAGSVSVPGSADTELTAVISAAVAHYRVTRR